MRISIKTVIALLATTICLILILNFVSNSVIQTNFSKIETEQVTQTIGNIQVAVSNRISEINNELVGWSQFTSTYQFIQNNNSEYQQTYLTVSALSNLGVNFVIFLDPNGSFVTGTGLNITTMQPIPIPKDIITQVSSENVIGNLTKMDSDMQGFIMTSEGPVIVASRPILMSDGEGPAKGILVFARCYDSSEIQKLSYTMNLPMSLVPIGDWDKANDIKSAPPSSLIKPVNQEYIMGYDVFVDINQQPIFAIGATIPRTVFDQGLSTIGYVDQVLLIAGISFSVIIILLLEFSVLRRLGKLTNTASKLRKRENFTQELPVSGNDEITLLTLSFNGLLQEIQSQSLKLQKSERMSAIGELARQIGHDLRNPLTSTKYATYYLRQKGNECTDKDREKMLNIIEGDIKRSDKIINDLIEYSSEIFLEIEGCSPKSLLKGTLLKLKFPEQIRVLDLTLEEPILFADVNKIRRVFTLIIKNAVDAMPKGGSLEIKSRQEDSLVHITFSDTGAGIPAELLPKVFSPLLTTKAQGMGFSLAICKRIIDSHGGKIEVESVEGKGTTFKVTLPIKPRINQENPKAQITKPDPLLHYKDNETATTQFTNDLPKNRID